MLWSARQQVWSRLEEGASQLLKVPPPLIEYVLPSPTLGNPTVEVPDPAWQTRKGTTAEEVQLKQDEAIVSTFDQRFFRLFFWRTRIYFRLK